MFLRTLRTQESTGTNRPGKIQIPGHLQQGKSLPGEVATLCRARWTETYTPPVSCILNSRHKRNSSRCALFGQQVPDFYLSFPRVDIAVRSLSKTITHGTSLSFSIVICFSARKRFERSASVSSSSGSLSACSRSSLYSLSRAEFMV